MQTKTGNLKPLKMASRANTLLWKCKHCRRKQYLYKGVEKIRILKVVIRFVLHCPFATDTHSRYEVLQKFYSTPEKDFLVDVGLVLLVEDLLKVGLYLITVLLTYKYTNSSNSVTQYCQFLLNIWFLILGTLPLTLYVCISINTALSVEIFRLLFLTCYHFHYILLHKCSRFIILTS